MQDSIIFEKTGKKMNSLKYFKHQFHPLRKEMEKLKMEIGKLKKEVEEVNAERVHLRRELNKRADKYSKLKHKMRHQQKE